MADTATVSLETDEASDELDVPVAIIEAISDQDESIPAVVGDLAMLALAQQAHGLVHHSHGSVDDDIEAGEARAMELFEDRFGRSFAEMTGHQH